MRQLYLTTIRVILLNLVLVLLPGVSSLANNDVSDLLHQANVAYSKQEYKSAIQHYESLLNKQGYSANVLFNLANSYAQAGQTGKAVLNYQRAQLLEPSDPDISRNLQVVLEKAGLFDKEKTIRETIVDSMTFNQWTLLSMAGLIILTSIFGLSLLLPRKKNILISLLLITLVLTFCALTGSILKHSLFYNGVVVTADNSLLDSPFASASSSGSIQDGKRVHITKEHRDYYLIVDDTLRKGWVPKTSIDKIIVK